MRAATPFSITTSASFGGLLEVDAGVLNFNTVSASIASFDQTGGTISGAGTLTVSGAAAFGSGAYNPDQELETGTGTTLLTGATTIANYVSGASYGLYLDGVRVLENQGTVDWTSGYIYVGENPYGTSLGGGTIRNDSAGTFDIQGADVVVNGAGTNAFVNAGTLEQTVTTGTSAIEVRSPTPAPCRCRRGRWSSTAAGRPPPERSPWRAGPRSISTPARSRCRAMLSAAPASWKCRAARRISPGPRSRAGWPSRAARSSIAASSGTAASLTQTGGTISGAGTLTVSGAAAFGSGAYNPDQELETGTGTTLLTGATTIANYVSGASYGLYLDGVRVLENQGTVDWTSGYIYVGENPYGTSLGGGTIRNDSAGTFDIQGADVVVNGAGTNAFVNAGTLEQTVTTGTSAIGVALTNTGAVSVQTGTLEFDGGGTSTAGTFTVASGATLDFDAGTFTLSGDAFSGAGVVEVSGGTTNITGATIASGLAVTGGTLSIAASSGTAASLTQTGGTISGAGTLTVSGAAAFGSGAYNPDQELETGTGTTLLTGATTIANYVSGASYGLYLDGVRVLENQGR